MKLIRFLGTALITAALTTATVWANPKDAVHSGTVTYAKTAGGYTYLKINEAGKEVWLAALPMEVAVGDLVEYAGGDVMKDFKSKAMNQTFDSIRFVSRVHVVNKDMPPDEIHKRVNVGHEKAKAPKRGEIARARNGRTVGEIYSERDKLAGQQIVLRAKVVKVSRNILGKNWVTLSDGTGKSPDDFIVVTTQELPAVGEVVTVAGTLKTNVNLGAGYSYKALLEGGKFTKG